MKTLVKQSNFLFKWEHTVYVCLNFVANHGRGDISYKPQNMNALLELDIK